MKNKTIWIIIIFLSLFLFTWLSVMWIFIMTIEYGIPGGGVFFALLGVIGIWIGTHYEMKDFFTNIREEYILDPKEDDVDYILVKSSQKARRIPISNKLKHEIWRRDKFTCQYCGKDINEAELEIDHIKPVSKGGTNAMSNLQTLCFYCNRSKSDK